MVCLYILPFVFVAYLHVQGFSVQVSNRLAPFTNAFSIAQRPCSRCLSNGKEDTCVDVQHKKRGRPRLRDEREPRYEVLGPNYPPPPDKMMRRPLLLYGEAPYTPMGEHSQRASAYRVLKSQSGMGTQLSPRHLEYASSADANIYNPQIPLTPRMFAPPDPICAYLNMEMQFAKVSPGFSETIGVQSVVSKKLQEVVSTNDRDKITRLQANLEEERRARELNYLPPIYLKIEEDRLIQSVSFGPEDMSQFRMEHQERITFHAPDGQQRTFQVRIGLAKKESTYIVALVLNIPATPQQYPQSSTYSREPQYAFMPQPSMNQPSPIPSSYMANPTFTDQRGDGTTYRTPVPLSSNIHPSMNMSALPQSQMRQEYPQVGNPYQPTRREQPQPQTRPPGRENDLQLPPILGQRQEGPAADTMQRRGDRSSRVDIGGLLDKRDHAGRGR